MSNIKDFVIEDGALKKYNGSDTDVVIPDGVTTIDIYAFRGCESLKSIYIADSVTEILQFAFLGCTSLTKVRMSNNINVITSDSFPGCTSLEYNEYENALYLGNEDNPWVALISLKSKSIETCNIASQTKCIAYRTFIRCDSLTNVVLPGSLNRIGYNTFSYCSSLKNVSILDGATIIEACAFKGCQSLSSIVIPKSIKLIEEEAFAECKSLSSLVISSGETIVEKRVFSDSDLLVACELPGTYGNNPTAWWKQRFSENILPVLALSNFNEKSLVTKYVIKLMFSYLFELTCVL